LNLFHSEHLISCCFGLQGAHNRAVESVQKHLLIRQRKFENGFKYGVDIQNRGPDEHDVVDISEHPHDVLAVGAVGKAAMSREDAVEIFDAICPLNARSKEAAERSDQRSEKGDNQRMELDGAQGDVGEIAAQFGDEKIGKLCRQVVILGKEYGVGFTRQGLKGIDFRTRADKPLKLANETREVERKNKSPEGSSNEAFPGFVGRYFEEGFVDKFLSKKESREVRRNVVAHNDGAGDQKPNNALVQIFNNKIALRDNQNKNHECPGHPGHLVLQVLPS